MMAPRNNESNEATETPSLPSPKNPLFAAVKVAELDRAMVKGARYQPASITNSDSLQKAMLEFDRRLEEEIIMVDVDVPNWVLVATQCHEIPTTKKITQLLSSTELNKTYSGAKFCLTQDGCLYIVSCSDKDRHGSAVECLLIAMGIFSKSVQNQRMLHCHINVIAQVDGNRSAPDAALKKRFPRQPGNISLRAPFIGEVHSAGKTVVGSLTFLSLYLDQAHSDYVMYIHIYPKDANDLFAAVAILWRAGAGNAPLTHGAMAQLATAQSFGTKPLNQQTIAALGQPYGHLSGIPPAALVIQPPQNIFVPRAQLLADVLGPDGQAVVADAGPDLIVELPILQDKLQDFQF